MEFLTVPFDKGYNREEFDCEKESLNNYFKKQISQDIKKKLAVCFIYLDDDEETIIGYYTLSNASIPYNNVPEGLRKKFPKSYDYIPVTLLGRLALDKNYKGKGYGSKILIDALKRSLKVAESDLGSVAVIADPLDDQAEKYYEHFGFIKLQSSGKMFLNMKAIKKLEL